MSKRILWNSWCRVEAAFELERISKLPMKNQWVNAYLTQPTIDDIWLTTNGYNYRQGPFKKITWYAESYIYLRSEYDNYARDVRWDKRFHFNPRYFSQPNSQQLQIMCWWEYEKSLFDEIIKNKKPTHTFGMVLGKKPTVQVHPSDFGFFRSKIVESCRNRSFRYYGTNWPAGDKNYKGEAYVKGNRGTPLKFHDARILMRDAKFVFACENTHDKHYSLNYLTEKIFHAFLSASVPIYCGCGNVEELIDPSLFIDVRKFNYDLPKILDYCEKMPDSEYSGYLSRITEFMNTKAKDFSCEKRFMQLDGMI